MIRIRLHLRSFLHRNQVVLAQAILRHFQALEPQMTCLAYLAEIVAHIEDQCELIVELLVYGVSPRLGLHGLVQQTGFLYVNSRPKQCYEAGFCRTMFSR